MTYFFKPMVVFPLVTLRLWSIPLLCSLNFGYGDPVDRGAQGAVCCVGLMGCGGQNTKLQAPSWAPLSIIQSWLRRTEYQHIHQLFHCHQDWTYTGYILLFSCSMGAFVCPAFFRVCFSVKGPPVIALWWKIILSAESPVIRGAG